MKKILAVILILICFSSLTACKEDKLDNNNSISDNSTIDQSTQEEPAKQIPIQNFDGHWKEVNLRERESAWAEILIVGEKISIYWVFSNSEFLDNYKYSTRIWDGTWKNPTEDVIEYSFISSHENDGMIRNDQGELVKQYSYKIFTYKDGRLGIERKPPDEPLMNYRTADIIYFEKISD